MYAFEESCDSVAQAEYYLYTSQRFGNTRARSSSSATHVSDAAKSHKSLGLSSMLRKRHGPWGQKKRKLAVGSSRVSFSQMAVAEAMSSFDSQALHANSLLLSPCATNTLPSPFFDNLASLPPHGVASATSQLPMHSYASPPAAFPSNKLGMFHSCQHVSTPTFDYCVPSEQDHDTACRAVPHMSTAMVDSSGFCSLLTSQKQLPGVSDLHANQTIHSSYPRMYITQISSRAACISSQPSKGGLTPDNPPALASSQASHQPQSKSTIQLLNRITEKSSVPASSGRCPPPTPRRPQPKHLHSLALKKFPPGHPARPVQSNTELLNKLLQLSATADTASNY